jgi:hypothetical protein
MIKIITYGILGLLFIMVLTSCKLVRDLDKSASATTSDSAGIKKSLDVNSSVDSSKSKKAKEWERTTYEYQPTPTPINNHIYPAPVRVIQEKGVETEENQNYLFIHEMRQMIDTMFKKMSEKTEVKHVESSNRFGPDTFQIIVICLLVFLLGKQFLTIKK